MAVQTADAELDKALDKIESHLDAKSEAAEERGADLAKALTEVAKGAIDLAKEKKKPKSKAKKAAATEALAKAREHDDDDDDDDHDDDDDDKPAWLKKKMVEKAIDWEALAADIPEATKTAKIAKSITVGDMDVFNMDDYLAKQLETQEAMAKSLDVANKTLKQYASLTKGLLQALSVLEDRLIAVEAQGDTQARTGATMAKALAYMLTEHEAVQSAPATSKYAAMEKSVAQVQRVMDEQGYSVFDASAPRNKELLSKAVLQGKITQADAITIKRTQRLPPGVSLN